MRAGLTGSPAAQEWTARLGREVRAIAPDLIWSEVGNAFRQSVRANLLTPAHADRALSALLQLPLHVQALAPLARPALAAALEREISVYDASYVVLAEALGAPLVTADRRLAAATDRAELIA